MTGDPSVAVELQRSLPTPFLSKTYQLVDDPIVDEIISWNTDGTGFVVWNPTEFARDLLPKYFKHNNFSSFVRQLNTYGFRKIVPDRWEFSNECFRKGEKQLLCDIQRRKFTPPVVAATTSVAATIVVTQPPATEAPPLVLVAESPSYSGEEHVFSSTCRDRSPSSGCTTELVDENERLKKENLQLNKELNQMKSMCNNIYSLMSNFGRSRQDSGSSSVKPLDLMAAKQNDIDHDYTNVIDGESSTGMFVSGAKRLRECQGQAEDHCQDLLLRLGVMDVKTEPLDQGYDCDDQECMWLG